MKIAIKKHLLWIIPILSLLIITPFTPQWDKTIAAKFYNQGFISNSFTTFIYNYGVLPGQILIVLSLLTFIFFKKWRKAALSLILTLGLGAGLIVHTLLKDHWGRPRPKQVVEFGGNLPFQPYYKPVFNQTEPARSFPCGHCTMGFCFFGLSFVLTKEKKQRWSLFFAFFALMLGMGLGLVRMMQGGHFFSDVLLSAIILWLVSYASTELVYSRWRC